MGGSGRRSRASPHPTYLYTNTLLSAEGRKEAELRSFLPSPPRATFVYIVYAGVLAGRVWWGRSEAPLPHQTLDQQVPAYTRSAMRNYFVGVGRAKQRSCASPLPTPRQSMFRIEESIVGVEGRRPPSTPTNTFFKSKQGSCRRTGCLVGGAELRSSPDQATSSPKATL